MGWKKYAWIRLFVEHEPVSGNGRNAYRHRYEVIGQVPTHPWETLEIATNIRLKQD